jgi:hypothetical protein
MPPGIAPFPPFEFGPTATDATPRQTAPAGLRLSAWLHRSALDERLARGVDTGDDERLALRAAQLASREQRDELALALEHTLETAEDPAEARRTTAVRTMGLRVPLQGREIRDSAPELEALIARLRDEDAIDAQGAAMTRRLLVDGASPLYYRGSAVTLRHAVRSARLALEPVSTGVEVEVPLAA